MSAQAGDKGGVHVLSSSLRSPVLGTLEVGVGCTALAAMAYVGPWEESHVHFRVLGAPAERLRGRQCCAFGFVLAVVFVLS